MDLGISQGGEWFVYPIWIVLDHKGTKGHGVIWMELDFVLINVSVKGVLYVEGIVIKVYGGIVGVLSTREEYVKI